MKVWLLVEADSVFDAQERVMEALERDAWTDAFIVDAYERNEGDVE